MAQYPQQAIPNPYQILGQALTTGGQQIQEYADNRNRLQILMQEMAQKKAAADLAAIEAKRQADSATAEEARKAAKFTAEQAQAAQSAKAMAEFRKYQQGEQRAKPQAPAQPYLAPGMGPNGEASFQPPQEFETVVPTREQMQSKAMELGVYGDPGVKAYFDDTDPTKTPEFLERMVGVKASAELKKADARQKFQTALEEYRQGRIDSRTLLSIRAAMDRAELSEKSKPKTDSGMPLQALGDTELKTLKDIQNTAYSIGKIRNLANTISGLKKGPIAGRILGKNPYDTELQSLERLVNQTVPSLARGVFGEVGVLTDQDVERYRKMLASVKDSPGLANQILDDLEDKIASAYRTTRDTYSQGGRDVSGFAADVDFKSLAKGQTRPPPSRGKKSADDYLKEAGL